MLLWTLFPTSAMNRSAVRIKIQGSSSKRQHLCISAHIFIFYFFHGLAHPSLRDFSSREMSRNNLRKIIAVASAGLSGSVNHRRDHHIHSASSFFFTVHNNLHAAALCIFFFSWLQLYIGIRFFINLLPAPFACNLVELFHNMENVCILISFESCA